MLKKVIFLVSGEEQEKAVDRMKENMGDKGLDIYYLDRSEVLGKMKLSPECNKDGECHKMYSCLTEGDDEACLITAPAEGDWFVEGIAGRGGCTKDEILFVTDSPSDLYSLQQEGMYAAAWLHAQNGQEDLSGAAYAVMDIEEMDWEALERIYLRLAGKPWTVIETERCMVREMTVEDVEAFYRIYAEPSITYYMEDLFPEIEEEREYTRNYIKKIYGFYGYGLWSIVCKENQEVIGRAGLSWREGFDTPELGFVIGVPYQRKGYAYEVCKAIVAYGEEELGFEKIQALVREGNRASACLCRKLGFWQEDRVEDKGVWYERYINGKK